MKFTKGRFHMSKSQGIEFEGFLSPWMRFCIGTAIVICAVAILLGLSTPMVLGLFK